jgi:hypothetical protein
VGAFYKLVRCLVMNMLFEVDVILGDEFMSKYNCILHYGRNCLIIQKGKRHIKVKAPFQIIAPELRRRLIPRLFLTYHVCLAVEKSCSMRRACVLGNAGSAGLRHYRVGVDYLFWPT